MRSLTLDCNEFEFQIRKKDEKNIMSRIQIQRQKYEFDYYRPVLMKSYLRLFLPSAQSKVPSEKIYRCYSCI